LAQWAFGWLHPNIGIGLAHYWSHKSRYAEGEDHIDFQGEEKERRDSMKSMMEGFFVALFFIFVLLAIPFNSYVQPLIIISAVIFALIGVIYGTFLSRSLFTINSFMAIVGVTGVVVNDSLVLIEFINKSYASGLSRREAVVAGTNIRLRPVLLTTMTTTLGLLPMAIGIPEYSIIWGTMAMTFVTGLCTATFLTIIIVPVEWDMLMACKKKHQGKTSDDPLPTTITIERLNRKH
jgi:HAE1 family hydrophobic/amphiphilic exporter-1